MPTDPLLPLPDSTEPKPNILYVALHGLISLVDVDKDGFIAYLLDMGAEHEYLYGTWLAEKEIPDRTPTNKPLSAKLLGVDSGNEHLSTALNAIVEHKTLPDEMGSKVVAVFRLPRPAKIHHFDLGLLPDKALAGTLTKLVRIPNHLTGIRVFEYTFKDRGSVFLQDGDLKFLWQCPALAQLQDRNVAVLHIYDQPAAELMDPHGHTQKEFNLSSDFLGSDVTLTQSTVSPTELEPKVPGFLQGELQCLTHREVFALGILLQVREQKLTGGGVGGCGPATGVCAPCNGLLVP
ncbi:MAG TPA: hypothetical protein VNV88_05830 [Candidatus Solibacter sp.]|jgi:hypothetical protein|nr:hypothetical protein [Candidatus Solibacter sp.]